VVGGKFSRPAADLRPLWPTARSDLLLMLCLSDTAHPWLGVTVMAAFGALLWAR
jgi:hypothetical protein